MDLSDDWYRQVIRNGRPAKGMPTWGTVLSPNQIEDLVALIGAWRAGSTVQPDYSITELLTNALFALEGSDIESAALHLERAMEAADGSDLEALQSAAVEITGEDQESAIEAVRTLLADWPLGDPAAGVPLYSANCAACHGVQGEGGIGPQLQMNAFIQSNNNAELVQFLLEGRPGTAMAGYLDRLDETQLADIVAIIRLWQVPH